MPGHISGRIRSKTNRMKRREAARGFRFDGSTRAFGALTALAAVPLMISCSSFDGERPNSFTNEPTASLPVSLPETSSHPQMTPSAIMAATSNFRKCIEGLWPQASQRGVSRQSFDLATRTLEPELKIMELLDAQPEFSKPVWDYLDVLVNDARIAAGRDMLTRFRPQFDAMEKSYGVDRHIITAIWGVESNFGTQAGDRPVIRSTATLACIGRRQDYFRDEFLAALEILHRGDVHPGDLKGSWAGAFGPTQFMPTAFKRYAVDFDGDGRRNIVGSVPDLLGSTANKLKKVGWQTGANWGYEVTLPKNFNFMLADQSVRKSLREWQAMGVRRASNQPFPHPEDQASLLLVAGARGPAFLTLNNFRMIMRYNPSESYALAIAHLADRIRGGGPFVQPWPREEVPLTRSERMEMQARLAQLGFYSGEPDGRLGPATRNAVRAFQSKAGLPPDGFASASLIARLRQGR